MILAHFFFNVGSNLIVNMLGLVDSMTYNIIGGIAGAIYLIIIIGWYGPARFSRLSESEMPIVRSNG